ncbi:MAG: diacylglycerol/lipid kinase family protein [Anaeroplasma sp.]
MNYLIYNPLAANNSGEKYKNKAIIDLKDDFKDLKIINALEIKLSEFKSTIKENDTLIFVGGDGTLNIVANLVKKYDVNNPIYLYEGGSGNDFLNDIGREGKVIQLNKYFKKLPIAEINGEKRYFINNVSFGIDGEVCVVAEEQKAKNKAKINYTTIAAKLLLGKYKKPNATIYVDGVKKEYKHVWLASSLNGRYIGGGMMVAPNQDRLSGELSCVVMHCKSRLKTLIAFPSIFSGKHVKKKKMVEIIKGKKIKVHFDRPTSLQIDGEVYKNVTDYTVYYSD